MGTGSIVGELTFMSMPWQEGYGQESRTVNALSFKTPNDAGIWSYDENQGWQITANSSN